jgi:hypothetical protein
MLYSLTIIKTELLKLRIGLQGSYISFIRKPFNNAIYSTGSHAILGSNFYGKSINILTFTFFNKIFQGQSDPNRPILR